MIDRVILEDVTKLIENEKYDKNLNNCSILITGATGLIAKYFCFLLLELNRQKNANIQIYALVRNQSKAEVAFKEYLNDQDFHLVIQDVCDEIQLEAKVDYILHAAGSASATAIKSNPVGIIRANTVGTMNVLEYAKRVNAKKVLFTSTREIYGQVEGKSLIQETDMGMIDPLNGRNSYPESKRMAEAIFKAYSNQYGIPFNVMRIAHTYGPTMALANDGRVMSDFLCCAIENRDIVLNSDGSAIRSFCYISDTVNGIMKVLINGEDGAAYNLSNEKEPYMIRDVAKKIISINGNSELKVSYVEADEETKKGYLSYKIVQMDTSKTEALGWGIQVPLEEGLARTIRYFREKEDK